MFGWLPPELRLVFIDSLAFIYGWVEYWFPGNEEEWNEFWETYEDVRSDIQEEIFDKNYMK
jgi:hypothetical protein